VGWALREAVAIERLDMARMLSAKAELPAEAAIRDAIGRRSCSDMLGVLFGDGPSERHARTLDAAYCLAVRCDHRAAVEWLRMRGATESALTPADRAIGAALAGEPNPAPAADVSGSLEEEHHRMLAWATRHGREAAVPALLRLGLDAATQDLDGETPLRLAVLAGAVDAVDALLHGGAPVDAPDFDGGTALDAAMGLSDRGLRERLTRRLLEAGAAPREAVPIEPEDADAMFERAADAIASGDAAALDALFDEEPSLAQARSARPHRATLLHYCGANGVEEQRQTPAATDPELARLLLDRGADVNATCLLYGGGATALGLALSSIHPVRAGSRRRLAEVLLRAGARLDGGRASANLSAMAALGDLDDLRQQLDPARASTTDWPEARQVQAAFWWACEFGRTAVAVYLLDCGADSGARNGNGQTGLHLAACDGWLDTVQGLLARGVPLEIENAWRATPLGSVLWSAVHHDPNVDYTPIVAALIDAGAAVDPRYLEWWRTQDVLTPSSKPRIEALLRRRSESSPAVT
jgi:ankyrin repeat protein